jgi:hypothetical protein
MQRKKMLIAGLAIALLIGIVSAATISYFGQVKMTATVNQAVLLDGKDINSMPINETATVAGGESFCRYHWLQSQTSVPVSLQFKTSGSDLRGINVTYTTTITERGTYEDYYSDCQRLVGLNVWLKLSDLLEKDLEYTVHVVNNPKFAPNINIFITDGSGNYRVIHAWGKDWTGTGLKTVTFKQLLDKTMGYGASIRYSLLPPDLPEGSPKYYYSESELINDYGSWYAYFVEVRAQAGASGGQVLRPVEFKAAGITIEVPDSDTFTTVTLQPGEFLPFYICYKFDLLIKPGTYDIYTTVKPAPAS